MNMTVTRHFLLTLSMYSLLTKQFSTVKIVLIYIQFKDFELLFVLVCLMWKKIIRLKHCITEIVMEISLNESMVYENGKRLCCTV